MEPLSVIIISYNEEKHIAQCIESVRMIADEIIVLDSFSDDHTAAIALQAGARVFQRVFEGYIEQKNHALLLACHNLVFCLDADERADEELIRSIQLLKQFSPAGAFSINRLNIYCGKPVRSGLWYPDRKTRIFHRQSAQWGGMNPHDRVVFHQPETIRHLPGHILHYSFNTTEEHIRRNDELSVIWARSAFDLGKPFRWYRWLFSPLWTFLNGYILKGGFRGGRMGFIIARFTAHYAFLKYERLRGLYREQQELKKSSQKVSPANMGTKTKFN
jgi:glycosyltransferase involved in cell wall biosynthesis